MMEERSKRVKGRVVLMKKGVLDFHDIKANVLDRVHELLGKGVSIQLISATSPDPAKGLLGKHGEESYLERWVSTISSLTSASDTEFWVTFDWDHEKMGVPGAFIIRNHHKSQFYLKTVTIEDIPGHGPVNFVCNSWVYPAHRYTHDRVFFSNKNQFPMLLKWVGLCGENLHADLRSEIRGVVKEEGGVTLGALEKMSLVKSVVYETMRIEPLVPYQYGRAREDLVVQSHDASFKVKKGEMLFGYQPFATKDSRIFEDAEVFVPGRFVGEGEKMLAHVLWSNGRETEEPTPSDKQCAGKNLVVVLCRVFLAELFLRYDTFEFEFKESGFGPRITITSLTKASTF